MKSVKAMLRGGLGNQCFIYAVARSIAVHHCAKVLLNLDYMEDDKVFKRKCALDAFCCEYTTELTKSRWVRMFEKMRYKMVSRLAKKVGRFYFDKRPAAYWGLPSGDIESVVLDGYWQSEKYFYDCRDTLLADFALRDNSWIKEDNLASQIKQEPESMFLHVRSYKEVPGRENGECALRLVRYYNDALAYVSANVARAKVFVFSDDVEWAKANILNTVTRRSHLNFVFNNSQSSQIRDFTLMRLCKHGIVADSSFSWWAGWLGEQERRVIGERPLRIRVNRRVMNDDFWPERWVAIDE